MKPIVPHFGKTIQNRLFFSYTLLMAVMLFVFLTVFFFYNFNLLKGQATAAMESMAVSALNALDNEFRKMDTVSMNISYSKLIENQFEAYRNPLGEGSSLTSEAERFVRSKNLADLFIATSGPNRTVKQMNLYEPEGTMIGAGIYTQSVSMDLTAAPWYDEVMALKGAKLLVGPHTDSLLTRDTNLRKDTLYLSLCRMYFTSTRQYAGIIEIKQDHDTVFSALSAMTANNPNAAEIRVLDGLGKPVYPVQQFLASGDQAEPILSALPSGVTDTVATQSIDGDDGQLLVSHIRSRWSDYTVLIIQPEKLFFAPLFTFIRLFLLASAILLLAAMWLSYAVAHKLASPIRHVHAAIRSLDLADLQDLPEGRVSSLNELEELNRAFKSMNSRLKDSLSELLMAKTQEMQARMQALQAQMDPHFYHNTLSTISILAEENMNDKVVEMCRHLSFMMRYVADERNQTVTLGDELAYAKRYLECMKIRYGDDLLYTVSIPEEILRIRVPKLIIQPLVENALKYGIHTDPPWEVRIEGSVTDDVWRISVQDNGPGFTQEAMEKVIQTADAYIASQSVPDLSINGMGLVNTRLRLYLREKDRTVFLLSNRAEGGAIVVIGGACRRDVAEETGETAFT